MARLSPLGPFRAFDNDGAPLAGGKLYTYEAGTSTPKVTYTDASEVTPNTNPVILDASGYANVWLDAGGYKFILKDANDVTLWSVDNISAEAPSSFGATVASVSTTTLITEAYANSLVICTAPLTLNLSTAASLGEGFYFTMKNISAGNVVVDPSFSETIDGNLTKTFQPNTSAIIITNGLVWYSVLVGLPLEGGTVTGPITLPGDPTSSLHAATKNYVDALPRYNFVINPAFTAWVRGTSSVISTTTATYTADRWGVRQVSGTVDLTVARQNGSSNELQFAHRVTRNAANTNTAIIYIGQPFETVNSRGLSGKKVALSFYARAGANINMSCYIPTGTGGADQSFTLMTTGGWTGYNLNTGQVNAITTARQRFTYILQLPSLVTQLGVMFGLSFSGVSAGTDWVELEGVKLETLASTEDSATEFVTPDIATTISQCQRYYRRNTNGNTIFSGNVTSAATYFLSVSFGGDMRGTPSVNLTPVAASNFANVIGAVSGVAPTGFYESRAATGTGAGSFTISWTADAEL